MGLFDKIKKKKFDLDGELEKLSEFMDPVEQRRALRVRFMELQNEGKIKESMKLMETYEQIEQSMIEQEQAKLHPGSQYFFRCYNCGTKIFYEPKEDYQLDQCPKCHINWNSKNLN